MQEHKEQKDSGSDHQKLPFNHHVCSDSGQFYITEVQEKLVFSIPVHVKRSIFSDDDFYSFLKNTDIFQPPRLA